MIAGTPDYVTPRLKTVMDVLRPGILSFWVDGPLPRQDRLKCLKLLATDVIPALREHARELAIVDPFERKPGSVPLRRRGVSSRWRGRSSTLRRDDSGEGGSRPTTPSGARATRSSRTPTATNVGLMRPIDPESRFVPQPR